MAGKRNTEMLPAGFRTMPLLELHRAIEERLNGLYGILCDQRDFLDFRIKSRADGTCYALVKRAGDDGAPVVAFGSGYDALSALDGLEGAIHAGNWRLDKPYNPGDRGGNGGEGSVG